MATPALAFAKLASDCEKDGLTTHNAEKIGAELAKTFGVNPEEVAFLRVEGANLVFAYPIKLHSVGTIPLNTSGSVAAKTATSKRSEAFNNFATTRHTSIFEAVELGGHALGQKFDHHTHVIQKLMTAPVLGPEGTVGIIQVCRKGPNPPAAGPDFSPADIQRLIAVAASLAKCFK